MGEEKRYVEALCYGRNRPVPDALDPAADFALHVSDYAEWRFWREKMGASWKEKAMDEWWYEFFQSD